MPKWLAFSIKKSKSRKTNQQNGCPDYCNYYYCLFALARRRNAIRSYFFYLLVRGSCLDDSREILYRRQIIHFLLPFPSHEKERKGKGTKIFTMAAGYVMHYVHMHGGVSFFFCECEFELSCCRCDGRGGTEEEEGKREGGALRQQHIPDIDEGRGRARVGPYKNKLFQFFYQFWGAYGRR